MNTIDDYERAIAGAVRAKEDWASLPAQMRSNMLQRIASELAARRQAIRDTLIAEVAKPFGEAEAEIDAALNMLRFFAGWPLWGRTPQVGECSGLSQGRVLLRPRGVAGLITPWNYPLSNPVQKIAAALVCGNTVIWRPSALCITSSRLLSETIAAATLPQGVFSMLIEDGSVLSRRLVDDGRVDAVSFTGSTEVGRQIYATASERLAAVQCEMGGKNAAVVLANADLQDAARKIAMGAFGFAGQKCTALSRVYVEAAVSDRFSQCLEAEVSALVVGDPREESTVVGPVISREKKLQLDQVCCDAVARGLRCVRPGEGASAADSGALFLPTIFYDVPQDDPLMQDELFGPVLAVARVANVGEALQRVNDCRYGLAASIFTSDATVAREFASRAEVGVVKVNQATPGLSVGLPASGWKNSGAGIGELAEESIRFFTKTTSVFA